MLFSVGLSNQPKKLLKFDPSKFPSINDSKFDIYFNAKGTYIPMKIDGIIQLERDSDLIQIVFDYVNTDFQWDHIEDEELDC